MSKANYGKVKSDEKINSHKDYSSANPIQISVYSDKIINECKIANIPRPNIKYEFAGFFIEFFAKPIKNIKKTSGKTSGKTSE